MAVTAVQQPIRDARWLFGEWCSWLWERTNGMRGGIRPRFGDGSDPSPGHRCRRGPQSTDCQGKGADRASIAQDALRDARAVRSGAAGEKFGGLYRAEFHHCGLLGREARGRVFRHGS